MLKRFLLIFGLLVPNMVISGPVEKSICKFIISRHLVHASSLIAGITEPNVKIDGKTLIHWAAMQPGENFTFFIKELLRIGVNPNIPGKAMVGEEIVFYGTPLTVYKAQEITSLMVAVSSDHPESLYNFMLLALFVDDVPDDVLMKFSDQRVLEQARKFNEERKTTDPRIMRRFKQCVLATDCTMNLIKMLKFLIDNNSRSDGAGSAGQ